MYNPSSVIDGYLTYDFSLYGTPQVEPALDQIRKKHYAECFKDYTGEIILVGITYDKNTKKHECQIERI